MRAQQAAGEGMDDNSATQLGLETHSTGAGIGWLELPHPTQFVLEPAACTMSNGCPCGEGVAVKVREALGISVVVYLVPSSQSDHSINHMTLR